MRFIFVILLLFSIAAKGQGIITGRVIDKETQKPIANASVFLSNATIGDKTREDGTFRLIKIRPAQYDLVVSIIGYDTFSQTLNITDGETHLSDIILTPRNTVLNEVVIRPDPNRVNNYQAFKQEFLGETEEAALCKIINPDAVDVSYDSDNRLLTASSQDFIEIENRALGYKVKYLLHNLSGTIKQVWCITKARYCLKTCWVEKKIKESG
ncbi:carboxypeptidase-like regulatory domain-containing protein [Mucilaginibacter sp. RS28]|uniref:Carboxypeptidase-like regulatory domain-containing protein n=1 Tax=Mucilaginibacter straminoryzae TaxID=2932774 RepID=A0A9X1X3V6_9SPHI|nr:carboxypeptidase-like regulatory domain-containing protein [Mucilaginibacter straminoryzae]MCJ8210672.1 carboxypeptidase-like regulatory domain-containing protein [Mucilaginibacter straminoryzae]